MEEQEMLLLVQEPVVQDGLEPVKTATMMVVKVVKAFLLSQEVVAVSILHLVEKEALVEVS